MQRYSDRLWFNHCGAEQFAANMKAARERDARRAALKLNPLVHHDFSDLLYMARGGDNAAIAELRRRDREGHTS